MEPVRRLRERGAIENRPGSPASFRRAWAIVLAAAAAVLLLASLPPFVGAEARSVLMTAFSGVCHQLPDRSFHIHGIALAACHRCYGIYAAMPLAVLAAPALRRCFSLPVAMRRFVLLASLLPPGIDWLAGALDLWHSAPLTRFLTGAVFGLAAGCFLTIALAENAQAREHITTDEQVPS